MGLKASCPFLFKTKGVLSNDMFRPPHSSGRGGGPRDNSGEDNGEDNVAEDNRNDAIAFKIFVDNLSEQLYDKPKWGGGGTLPPSDGSITDADCAFAFLSRWFGVSCVVGNWIFAMGVLVIIAIPVVAIVLAYFRRRLREAEKLTRKPYEELCALLADVNVSEFRVFIPRRLFKMSVYLELVCFTLELSLSSFWQVCFIAVIMPQSNASLSQVR